MADTLTDQFRAFELLDDDEPMRGFHRILRCSLRDWQRLYAHEAFGFEQPFDVRFAKAMVKTLSYLVATDGQLQYGYAEHAEISLLLNGSDEPAGRESGDSEPADDSEVESARRVVCRVASGAAGRLSLVLGDLARFDVRLYQFPSAELAKTFFLWRQQCQRRVSLDRHVAHLLVSNGQEPEVAQDMVSDFGEEEKLEILTQHEISFEDLPIWQRRGAGCYWLDSKDDSSTLTVDTTLPVGEQYTEYLGRFL
jgi:tRNA(His) 5'-end guanylyltransferase